MVFLFIVHKCLVYTCSIIFRQSLLSQVVPFYIWSDRGKYSACKGKAGLWMPTLPKYIVERANLQWKNFEARLDMLTATKGSLAPNGIGHPFWKMSPDTRDPVSKWTKDYFDFILYDHSQGWLWFLREGNVTNIDSHLLKVFLYPSWSIGYKGK